jgi:hypothetical protein
MENWQSRTGAELRAARRVGIAHRSLPGARPILHPPSGPVLAPLFAPFSILHSPFRPLRGLDAAED